jgi:hypothetical protein
MLIVIAFSTLLVPAAPASPASAPHLVATVVKAVAHKPYPRAGALITVAFTVGEPNEPAGSGVPAGSVFDVQLTKRAGLATPLATATGEGGHFRATIRWSGGRIRAIRIGGFLNAVPSTAQGGFWLPVTVLKKNF